MEAHVTLVCVGIAVDVVDCPVVEPAARSSGFFKRYQRALIIGRTLPGESSNHFAVYLDRAAAPGTGVDEHVNL